MRAALIVVLSVAGCVVALFAGGCDQTCRTVTCASSAATYQVCSPAQISTYTFGGQSCTCELVGYRTGCSSCLGMVASFCGGSPPPCTIALSGALAGEFACESLVSYRSKNEISEVGLFASY